MLGIAAKAGHVASGEFSTEKAVKTGQAFLVIVSSEASENTKKAFGNMTDFYRVPMYLYGSKEELGQCIGKQFRASLAVTDENLAHAVEKALTIKLNNGGK
jgi:ribosomal protein L7Ae-like RNA K-turn-binding protein